MTDDEKVRAVRELLARASWNDSAYGYVALYGVSAADMTSLRALVAEKPKLPQCPATRGKHRCDQPEGHAGSHSEYLFVVSWSGSDPKPKRSCNRHEDCDAADEKVRTNPSLGRNWADHCDDACCEDCFGT